MNKTKWRKLLWWLRKNFSTDLPIIVRCKDKLSFYPNDSGICVRFENKYIRIEISNKQCYYLKVDAIIHEWAHAITMKDNTIEEHGNEWGKAYSRIYRSFIDWNYGEENPEI